MLKKFRTIFAKVLYNEDTYSKLVFVGSKGLENDIGLQSETSIVGINFRDSSQEFSLIYVQLKIILFIF